MNNASLACRLSRLLELVSAKAAYTVAECEVLTGISRAQLYRAAARGDFRLCEGRIRRADLEQLLQDQFDADD